MNKRDALKADRRKLIADIDSLMADQEDALLMDGDHINTLLVIRSRLILKREALQEVNTRLSRFSGFRNWRIRVWQARFDDAQARIRAYKPLTPGDPIAREAYAIAVEHSNVARLRD